MGLQPEDVTDHALCMSGHTSTQEVDRLLNFQGLSCMGDLRLDSRAAPVSQIMGENGDCQVTEGQT